MNTASFFRSRWTQSFLLGGCFLSSLWFVTHGGWVATFPADASPGLKTLPTIRFWGVIYQLVVTAPLLAGFWLAVMGYGTLLRRWLALDGLLIQTGLGLATMLWLDWLLAWAGLMHGIVPWAVLLVGLALSAKQYWQFKNAAPGSPPAPGSPSENSPVLSSTAISQRRVLKSSEGPDSSSDSLRCFWVLLAAMPILALALTACCCPPGTLWKVEAFGYDVLSYHLQLPGEWLALGQMRGLEHNVYSFFPSLMEVAYLHLAGLMGSVYRAIYACQMLHFSMAVLTSLCIGQGVARQTNRFWGRLAGLAFLTVPWTIIVSTLAYNEMLALALGATALIVAFDTTLTSKRAAIACGLLVGAATLTKLTAGPMLAVPVGLLFLLKLNAQSDRQWTGALWAAGAGLLVLSPYLARNTIQTGNPVFPMATQTFGAGHWSSADVKRWDDGHANQTTWSQRSSEIARQWLCNEGYGSILGRTRYRQPGSIESQNIARFDREWGMPTFWLLALGSGLSLLVAGSHKRLAIALWLMLLFQLAFWLTATHLQARFLIWLLLPGTWMLGLACPQKKIFQRAMTALMALWICLGTGLSIQLFQQQIVAKQSAWYFIDSLPTEQMLEQAKPGQLITGDHIINHLPADSYTYLIADSSRSLYIRNRFMYHSAFDPSPLGQWIREARHNPQAVTARLKQEGITHVWIHWGELARLHATYGFDPDVTPPMLQQMIATGWKSVFSAGRAVNLYELP